MVFFVSTHVVYISRPLIINKNILLFEYLTNYNLPANTISPSILLTPDIIGTGVAFLVNISG